MSGNPNRLSRFWHELKRRNVIRVIAMYAGVAYIIIELVSNVSEPLHLPEWVATFVILLLITGFPVVAITSWIFDITPEGVKKTGPEETREQVTTGSSRRRLKISDVIIAILVAVMPFQNITNDSIWNVWQNGIQFNVYTILSNYSGELKVRQSETTNYLTRDEGIRNYASMSPDLAGRVSKRLDANVFVFGNIIQSGSTIRLNAQLIDAETKNAYRSFQIDGTDQEILHLIDSLSVMLKNSLLISSLALELPSGLRYHPSTTSPEAYRYFLYGDNVRSRRDYETAKEMYSNTLATDSNFAMATLMLSVTCIEQYRSIYRDNSWSGAALARNLGWAYFQAGMPGKAEESFRRAVNLEPESGFWYYYLAERLIDHDRDIDEGLELIERALELNPDYEWYFLDSKGRELYKKGKYQEALEILHRCRDLQIYCNHELTLHTEEAEKALSKQASISN